MPATEIFSSNFHDLPKADCHLHLTGALEPADIRELAAVTGVDIRTDEPLEDLMAFTNERIWPLTKEITSHPAGLAGAMGLLAMRAAQDTVRHLEITINPASMRTRYGLVIPDFVAATAEAIDQAKDHDVELTIKCGVNRREGPGSVEAVEEFFTALPEEHRAFIDLNGEEATYPTESFVEAFRDLTRRELPVVVHAGEFGEPQAAEVSLQSALDMKPQRIAHALAAYRRSDLLRRIIDQDIVVEVAPTSNILTGVIPNEDQHPIAHFYHNGVKLVLGTDDPALFGNNTISDELVVSVRAGLTMDEAIDLNRQSLTNVIK